MPKDNREGQATILEAFELEKLCNSFPMGQHRIISYVLTFTSCRVSEALSLKFRNIKKDYILLKAKDTKTNEEREIPLHPTLKKVLNDWEENHWYKYPLRNQREINLEWARPDLDDWLFKGAKRGQHLSRQAFDRQMRKYTESLNFEGCSTHTYRRSGLTAADEAGMTLNAIKSISGHSSLDALAKYLETSPKRKKAVVASMGF